MKSFLLERERESGEPPGPPIKKRTKGDIKRNKEGFYGVENEWQGPFRLRENRREEEKIYKRIAGRGMNDIRGRERKKERKRKRRKEICISIRRVSIATPSWLT